MEYRQCLRNIRENASSVIITIFLLVVIITLPATMRTTTIINLVYDQQPDQMDLNITDSSADIQNTSEEKIVQVGDIDIAYKMSGEGEIVKQSFCVLRCFKYCVSRDYN